MTVEEVVTEHEARRLAIQKVLGQQESLCDPLGAGLHAIGDRNPPLRAIAEQATEQRFVIGRRDHEDVTDAREHQRGERVVDERLVIHGQQLLADRPGHRIQPGTGTAGKNDAFANHDCGQPLRNRRRA